MSNAPCTVKIHPRRTVFTGCQMGGGQHARQIFSPVFVLGRPRKSKSVLVVGEGEDVSREDSRIPTIEIDLSFLLFIPSLWLLPLSCVLANSHVTEIVTDPASTSVVDRGGFGNG